MDMNHFKLQFITHFTDTYSYLDSARMALEGGCRWVQLRMKHASDEETEAVAVEVQKLCRTYGATFLKRKAQPHPRTGGLPFHRTADEGGRHPPAHRSHRRHHPGRHPCHYADRCDGHCPERYHPAGSESGGRDEENRKSIKNE